MIYLDTNLLVALVVNEPASARVHSWLSQQAGEQMATSLWALMETTSALSIKVRRRDITQRTATAAAQLLDEQIVPMLELLDVTSAAFIRGEILLRSTELGLRAGDALHLAICLGNRSTVLATADTRLHGAALKMQQPAFKVY
ncbi:MAG: type II toxin-antitoxin system VapC family toxin [Burkholderiaceae bacterium]